MESLNDEKFRIRTMVITDLAMLYFPELGKESARKKLKQFIREDRDLFKALKSAHFRKRQRTLTPRQVKILVEFLGEP